MKRPSKEKTYLYTILGISAAALIILSAIFADNLRGVRSTGLSGAEKAAAKSGRKITDWMSFLPSLFSVHAENQRLRDENERLRREVSDLRVFRSDNIRLRALLNLKKSSPAKSIAAEVCGRDVESWFSRFEIDKGERDGVKKHMIVMGERGLVGLVTAVYPGTSLVRTLHHKNSMIPVYAVEAGAFAMLSGEGGEKAVLRYIYNSSLIDDGQLIVTSGIGKIYPEGLPIGVTEKNKKGEMEVKTFADIKSTGKVIVFERAKE